MSNEEIVVRIQAGETELNEVLWLQVEGLVKWQAKRVMMAIESGGYSRGVAFEDLCQVGFLAMLEAIGTYNQENGAFSTWLMFYLKRSFAEATGYRTVKDRNEPMNSAISLDKPLLEDSDRGGTFCDIVPDPKATATLTAVENRLWHKQLREAMEDVLSKLPATQNKVLRQRYYDQQTLAEIAERMGITVEAVRHLEWNGLKALRHYKLANRIRPFYYFDFYSATGLQTFRRSGISAQERYLLHKEAWEAREHLKEQQRKEMWQRQLADAESLLRGAEDCREGGKL